MVDHTLFIQKAPGVMQQLMDDFELNEIQSAGILGNLGHECAGFHVLHEIGQPEGKGGYGWAQWTGPRRRAFFEWCQNNGFPPPPGVGWKSDEANYGFLQHELSTAPYHHAIAAVLKTNSISASVYAFERAYEGAGIPNYKSRESWAQIALDAYNNASA